MNTKRNISFLGEGFEKFVRYYHAETVRRKRVEILRAISGPDKWPSPSRLERICVCPFLQNNNKVGQQVFLLAIDKAMNTKRNISFLSVGAQNSAYRLAKINKRLTQRVSRLFSDKRLNF